MTPVQHEAYKTHVSANTGLTGGAVMLVGSLAPDLWPVFWAGMALALFNGGFLIWESLAAGRRWRLAQEHYRDYCRMLESHLEAGGTLMIISDGQRTIAVPIWTPGDNTDSI